MMFFLAYIGGKLLGFGQWCIENWRTSLVFLAIIIVMIASGLLLRSCSRKRAHIELKQVDAINNANDKERRQELRAIVVENQDVIKTVDERTELQNVNNVEKEAEIDAKVAVANQKVLESKSHGEDVTGPELEKILMGDQ